MGRHVEHEPEWCWQVRALACFLAALGLVLFAVCLVSLCLVERPVFLPGADGGQSTSMSSVSSSSSP